MCERDYLMNLLAQFAQAIGRAIHKAQHERNPIEAGQMLDEAITAATDIDGSIMLTLAPESISMIMNASGVDPYVVEYIARSMDLAGNYYTEGGSAELGTLRKQQAQAVASAYGIDLSTAFELPAEADLDDILPA